MIRQAVDRSRPTGGGMATSVAVHGLLLLLFGMALREEVPLPISPEELTKITYIEARPDENLAQKIRTRTRATRHPKLAEGRGISTRSAQKPKSMTKVGEVPRIERSTRETVTDIATPMPAPRQTQPRQLAVAPRLKANAQELARVQVATPQSRRASSVEDAADTAVPRLEAKVVPRRLEGSPPGLENKRARLDLAGGEIDPPGRSSSTSASGVADIGTRTPAKATLEGARKGAALGNARVGLTPARRSGGGIADVGAKGIAASRGGGSDDRSGRRTILDYGSGQGGGLRGRPGGGALAADRSAVDPTGGGEDQTPARIAEAQAMDLSAQGMDMSVSGQISGRKILRVVAPEYSRSAKQKGWEGVVAVHFTVLPDGRVKDNFYLEQTSAHRDLNRSAMAAIRQFRFAPLPGEEPQVEQWGIITFVFRLK